MTTEEIVARLGLATLAGVLLGLDREARGFPAGIRTNGIVSLSSAAITVSALMLTDDLALRGYTDIDPTRVIQGLAQAIGFIAAGLMFTAGRTVHNVTTAASLWLSAVIGITCGAAQFKLAFVGLCFGLVLLVGVWLLEKYLPVIIRKRD